MGIFIGTIYTILLAHYLSDFVAQTDWMATQKSTSNKALAIHIAAYSSTMLGVMYLCMLAFGFYSIPLIALLSWVALNGAMHFGTDYVSSRMSKRAYESGNLRRFWAIIGADQLVHLVTLFATWGLLTRWG